LGACITHFVRRLKPTVNKISSLRDFSPLTIPLYVVNFSFLSGIFTKTALSRATGINQRQISHYASGRITPRPKQRERIIKGIYAISRELASVV